VTYLETARGSDELRVVHLDQHATAEQIRRAAGACPIGGAPDGPATPEAATARRALEILGEASRVRRRGDEDWTHCQELITWADKLALGRLKPTLTMPDEVWEFHRNESGGTSRWLESRTPPGASVMLNQPALTPAFRTR